MRMYKPEGSRSARFRGWAGTPIFRGKAHRSRSDLRARTACALCVTLACAGSAVAQDVFVDTPTFENYFLAGVPDYDQRRMPANVNIGGTVYSVLGLPNNGGEYCIPTSATNWTSFLAHRGWSAFGLGPADFDGSWTEGVAGLNQYNAVDLTIYSMGIDMHTDPLHGTSGFGCPGLQQFIDSAYPGQFVVAHMLSTGGKYPRMTQLLRAGLEGKLVLTIGGWYKPTTYNGVPFWYRSGGHACSLAEATWQSGITGVAIGLCNPADGDSDKTVQSAFAYTPYKTTPAVVNLTQVYSGTTTPIPGTQHTSSVDYIKQSANWILDGAYVIQPLQGFTIIGSSLIQLTPNALVNRRFANVARETVSSPDGSPITSECSDAVSGLLYFTDAASPNLLRICDPLSGRVNSVRAPAAIRQVLGGSDSDPYILTGTGTIGQLELNQGGGFFHAKANLGNVDRLVFDTVNNWIGAVNFTAQKVTFVDRTGVTRATMRLPAVQDHIHTTVQMGPMGHLFMSQPGSPNLLELSLRHDGSTQTVVFVIADLASASSFDIDDRGRLYLSSHGIIVVCDLNGNRLITPFSGKTVGLPYRVSRVLNNYDQAIHGTPEWWDVPPQG